MIGIRTLRFVLLALPLLLGVAPGAGTAQIRLDPEGAWAVSITPRLGFLQPGNAGPLQGWESEGLRVVGGPVAGVALELRTPLPWVAVRATMDRSVRNQLFVDPLQATNPVMDPVLFNRSNALQSQVSLGGVLRPLPDLPIRPTAIAGLGVRHWEWRPGDLPRSFDRRFPESEWDRAWHWGAGIEADANPIAIRFEVLNYAARVDQPGVGRVRANDRFLMLSFAWTGAATR